MNLKIIIRGFRFLIVVISLGIAFTTVIKIKSACAESGIVYGKDHVFSLKAPNGWLLDNASGVKQGLHAVFYPLGSSWEDSSVVMYAKVVSKSNPEYETLEKAVKRDVDEFKEKSPALKIKSGKNLLTSNKKNVIVLKFLGDRFGNYETVAYIDEEQVIVFLVLSAKNQKNYKKSIRAYRELVGSYTFLTESL